MPALATSEPSASQRLVGEDVRIHRAFPSKFVATPRDVLVWLLKFLFSPTSKTAQQ